MATTKRRITRQELERDELAESIQDLRQTFMANRLKIGIIAGAVILALVVILGYSAYRSRVVTESSQILNSANVLFSELPGLQDEGERTKRLQAMVGSLQDLVDRYSDSEAARTALFLKGNCYYYMDDLAKAQQTFEKYLSNSSTAADKARGEIALGYTLENQFYFDDTKKKKLDEAITHYDFAVSSAPAKSYLYYSALMNKARILELTSRDADAIKIYKQIMEERPAPRATAANKKQSDEEMFKGGLVGFVEKQVQTRLEPLSFFATAKLRVDQLEATSKVLRPKGADAAASFRSPVSASDLEKIVVPTPAESPAPGSAPAPAKP